MGMFDRLRDSYGHEWQTKAFDCNLDDISIGEPVAANDYGLTTYQVEVLGGPEHDSFIESYATIRDRLLSFVPAERDPSLPLLNYSGHLVAKGI